MLPLPFWPLFSTSHRNHNPSPDVLKVAKKIVGGTLCVDHSQIIKPHTLVSTDSVSDLPREFLKKTHSLKTQPQVAGWSVGMGKGREKKSCQSSFAELAVNLQSIL